MSVLRRFLRATRTEGEGTPRPYGFQDLPRFRAQRSQGRSAPASLGCRPSATISLLSAGGVWGWGPVGAAVGGGGRFPGFPGVDRIITLVDGPGMTLTVDGVARQVDTPYEPFAFSGDAVTECRL
ncbi:HutD family protein, partial [Streptomyces prasinus]|uniref:HutD family protein n=1 Tax=Streptomyces prasinus TaxID=67345 RepID=UPI00362BD862